MKRQSVDSHVRDFYQNIELSSQKCQQLLEQAEWLMSETAQQKNPGLKNVLVNWINVIPWPGRLVWSGATLALVFMLFVLSPIQQVKEKEFLIAKEIALNHNKQLDSDFVYDNISQLDEVMSKLDFALVESDLLKQKGLTLAGGRYCSIHGHMAAQLRFYDADNHRYTLYQVGMQKEFEKVRGGVLVVDGALVEVWQEDGNLFGLARNE